MEGGVTKLIPSVEQCLASVLSATTTNGMTTPCPDWSCSNLPKNERKRKCLKIQKLCNLEVKFEHHMTTEFIVSNKRWDVLKL